MFFSTKLVNPALIVLPFLPPSLSLSLSLVRARRHVVTVDQRSRVRKKGTAFKARKSEREPRWSKDRHQPVTVGRTIVLHGDVARQEVAGKTEREREREREREKGRRNRRFQPYQFYVVHFTGFLSAHAIESVILGAFIGMRILRIAFVSTITPVYVFITLELFVICYSSIPLSRSQFKNICVKVMRRY